MAKVQGFQVVKEGLVSLSDVKQITPISKGINGIGNFMLPPVGAIFTDNGSDRNEFRESWLNGELRNLILEGAVKPVEIEGVEANIPEFNANNKADKKDLASLSVDELEKLLEEKKKKQLIEKIQQEQAKETKKEDPIPSESEIEDFKKEYNIEDDKKKGNSGVDPILKDFVGLTYQSKLSYISKTDDKAILKAIVNLPNEVTVVKNRALDKLAK